MSQQTSQVWLTSASMSELVEMLPFRHSQCSPVPCGSEWFAFAPVWRALAHLVVQELSKLTHCPGLLAYGHQKCMARERFIARYHYLYLMFGTEANTATPCRMVLLEVRSQPSQYRGSSTSPTLHLSQLPSAKDHLRRMLYRPTSVVVVVLLLGRWSPAT